MMTDCSAEHDEMEWEIERMPMEMTVAVEWQGMACNRMEKVS